MRYFSAYMPFEVNIYAAMRSYPVRFRFGKIPSDAVWADFLPCRSRLTVTELKRLSRHSPIRKSLTAVCCSETSSKRLVHSPFWGHWLAMPTHILPG